MSPQEILQKFSFLQDATPDTHREMLAAARMVALKRGTIYLDDGGHTDVMALVGAGRLRVFKTSESGREITLYSVGPAEFCMLNLLCVLTGRRAPATARVVQPVEALVFKGDDFRRWIGTDPAVRNHVFAILANNVTETMSLVEEIAFKKMDVRLAEYLRSRLPEGDRMGVKVEVTHEMIASELGSAREVISRLLKEFERQGAVALGRGRITLNNPEVLRALAQGA